VSGAVFFSPDGGGQFINRPFWACVDRSTAGRNHHYASVPVLRGRHLLHRQQNRATQAAAGSHSGWLDCLPPPESAYLVAEHRYAMCHESGFALAGLRRIHFFRCQSGQRWLLSGGLSARQDIAIQHNHLIVLCLTWPPTFSAPDHDKANILFWLKTGNGVQFLLQGRRVASVDQPYPWAGQRRNRLFRTAARFGTCSTTAPADAK